MLLGTIGGKVVEEHNDQWGGGDTCRHWGTLVKAVVRNEGPLKTIKDEEERLRL